MLAQKRATAFRPSYSKGIGGIETKPSSVKRATSAATSADSHALTNFATIASSEGESGEGGAVARAFAREGAKLFLTGRHRSPVEAVAKEILSASGFAEAAEVDALDEEAVDKHLQSVIDKAGRVDISFNAVGIPNKKVIGVPLADMDVKQFSLPITSYATSYFLTARLAARRMVPNKSGEIMTVTAVHSREGIPLVGGYGP